MKSKNAAGATPPFSARVTTSASASVIMPSNKLWHNFTRRASSLSPQCTTLAAIDFR